MKFRQIEFDLSADEWNTIIDLVLHTNPENISDNQNRVRSMFLTENTLRHADIIWIRQPRESSNFTKVMRD